MTPSEYTSVAVVIALPRTCSGTRVVRGHRHHGLVRASAGHSRVEQLGDAEVEELGDAFLGHQDVPGLEVPVDDEAAVRVLHRRAHPLEQPEPLGDGELALVAVAIDGHALHVLHDEVGQPLLGGAAVQEPGDVGVLQPGEDLPFAPEEAEDLLAVRAADHLQRDPLLELLVGPRGEPHRSHPPAPQLADQLVRTDAPLGVEARSLESEGAVPRLPGERWCPRRAARWAPSRAKSRSATGGGQARTPRSVRRGVGPRVRAPARGTGTRRRPPAAPRPA